MGSNMKTLFVATVLFIAAEALPMHMAHDQISKDADMIRSAQSDLKSMLKDEAKELSDMSDIRETIDSDEMGEISMEEVADRIETDTKDADKGEVDQQQAAEQSLVKVNTAIADIESSQELGEGASETPIEHAMKKLKQVQSTLSRGTKTSHTMERIERMTEEAESLKTKTSEGPTAKETTVATHSSWTFPPASHASHTIPSADQGAISALLESDQKQQAQDGQKALDELKHISQQEEMVKAAEQASQAEIGRMVKDLN